MAIKPIIMTDKDRERLEPVLTEYYRSKGLDESKIQKQIDKVFAQSQAGWERAPNDLDTRIKMKSGFQWKSHSNLKPKQKQIKDNSPATKEEDDDSTDLIKTLSKGEREWWDERSRIYKKDFEFNDSSDKPLLDQLLLEELMQRRLFKMQVKYKDRSYSKELTDSMKRVTELQSRLGITREQRAGIMNKIDGNVAHLSLQLEEKLREMPDKMREQYEEEMKYKAIRDQREPVNILPPLEKVEALLNVDGKMSANLDSTRISEISEEVAKEISDKRERAEDKKKPPKKELAEGMEI